jgi:hypothetical protein
MFSQDFYILYGADSYSTAVQSSSSDLAGATEQYDYTALVSFYYKLTLTTILLSHDHYVLVRITADLHACLYLY